MNGKFLSHKPLSSNETTGPDGLQVVKVSNKIMHTAADESKSDFQTVSIDKKFLPTAASGLCSIHAAQVIPLLHGTDRCSNLLCDGQKRCCKPWSDEGPGALSHYSTAFSTTVLISQILAYVKESSDAGVGPLAFPSRAKDSWFLGAPDSVVL